jgi:Cation transporter/ATPase, N-terminus
MTGRDGIAALGREDGPAPGRGAFERPSSVRSGLTSAETAARLSGVGPMAVRSHRERVLQILRRQFRSALLLLLLLLVTAVVTALIGSRR